MSWLGDVIGSTVGETVEKVGNTIKKFVTTDADRMQLENELTKIKAEAQQKADEIGVQYEQIAAKNAEDINKTMQNEAASEHWMSYCWRPFIGFVFGLTLLLATVIVGYIVIKAVLDNHYEALAHIPAVVGAFSLLLSVPLPVLGIASWFRGKMQADPNIPTLNRG